eukprot:38474_1
MLSVSNIISIIYFAANILLLLALALYIKKTGEHKSIKSTLFLKDLWSQRKIYAPIIVHFYDTATDIGVLYYWYTLMKDEQEYGGEYYQSVNMKSFFWTGIAFLSVYRLCVFIFAIWNWLCDGDGDWYDIILVLLDLYIFKTVYESFSEAQGVITGNARKRQKNKAKKQAKRDAKQPQNAVELAEIQAMMQFGEEEEEIEPAEIQAMMQLAETGADELAETGAKTIQAVINEEEEEIEPAEIQAMMQLADTGADELAETGAKTIQAVINEEEEEIEPAEIQAMMQFGESITESMPQIVLQSVFIIRSGNDAKLLEAGSNIYLVMFSVIASLFSISSKFISFDRDYVKEKAKSLKASQQFPDCIQYWYAIRCIWRMAHIMSRFAVFVLIWAVMGGAWLPIWTLISYIWLVIACALYMHEDIECDCSDIFLDLFLPPLALIVGIVGEREQYLFYVFKFIETIVGIVIITVFAMSKFTCGICSDAGNRQLFNNDNNRILIFWSLALICSFTDMFLYVIMYYSNIFQVKEPYFEEHGKYIQLSGVYDETATMINDDDPYLVNSVYWWRSITGGRTYSFYRVKFEIQIHSVGENKDEMCIGVIYPEDTILHDSFLKKTGYQWHAYASSGKIISYGESDEDVKDSVKPRILKTGEQYVKGDVVVVTIRMLAKTKCSVCFELNGSIQQEMELDGDRYTLAISLQNGSSVSIKNIDKTLKPKDKAVI